MKVINQILVILFLAIVIQNASALKPDSVYRVRPENYGLIYKKMDIKTMDGYTIKAWFYPPQDLIQNEDTLDMYFKDPKLRPYQLTDNNSKPTIIVCDGDADNMMGTIVFAMGFVQKGYNVVTFDWRGFGESDRFPIDRNLLCYPEFLLDYNAVINYISTMDEVDSGNIGVYGFSTGAYLSFAVAYTNPLIKCFVGRALMTGFDDFLPLLFKEEPNKKNIVRKPDNYPVDLYPKNIAPEFVKPAFLIVGENDYRTPVSMSEEIYIQLKGPKKLWIVPGAGHGGRNGPEFINSQQFFENVIEFYNEYLMK